jgi:hypothetical protein
MESNSHLKILIKQVNSNFLKLSIKIYLNNFSNSILTTNRMNKDKQVILEIKCKRLKINYPLEINLIGK